jgi:hypothetical protein
MQRVFSFRQGDRSEYLAQYILSSIAISVPVPRQEDVGSDFHCSLLRKVDGNLHPYLPFNIQVKSYGPDVLKNGVRFGGITKGKKPKGGKWREHEIHQLCQTDTPFLVGVVNKDEQWLDLFSTITRYFVVANWSGTGPPREVALIPYLPEGEGHLGNGEIVKRKAKPNMPDEFLTLPIGQPIIRIRIEDSENVEKCEEIKTILEPYLRLDQENAVLTRIGLGYFQWPLIMRPGIPLHRLGIGFAFRPSGKAPSGKQLETLYRLVGSILKNYQNTGNKNAILPWISVIDQLPLRDVDPLTQQVLADVRAFATADSTTATESI